MYCWDAPPGFDSLAPILSKLDHPDAKGRVSTGQVVFQVLFQVQAVEKA